MRTSGVKLPPKTRGISKSRTESSKRPFDIDVAMERIREAIKPFAKAALFELAEDGFNSVFEQLVACIISIRTFDEVTIPTARKLFAVARRPAEISRLSVSEIDRLIGTSTFHEAKARSIRDIAIETVKKHGGSLPCDAEVLMGLHGVGPKCANLVLGIACGQGRVAVDIHVHRVTNRWGYVQAKTPEQTMVALEAHLPKRYWVEINRLLVPFGKHICTGRLPHCSTCPVLDMCRQVGVKAHQ
ncbi:MAG: DNA-(Apurinic or apyrimidinic site) lyase [Pedosphaera sp.]|nr:DNA-(Apurinic or apyrimidinic site) lyase [Pedosphaera sp.]